MKELQQWLKGLGKDYSLEEVNNSKCLYLDYNNLTSLPESIYELKNLEWLYLSNNNLTSLPKSIVELSNLRRLYLSNNPNLVLLKSQIKFIESIEHHSDLSKFKIIPDNNFAKNLFL